MNDLTCTAEVYALMREYVDADQLQDLGEEVVDILVEEGGYSYAKIEEYLGAFDEIYNAMLHEQEEDLTEEDDMYEEDMLEDDYSDEE